MLTGADTILEVDNVSKLYSRSALESQQRLGQVIWAACFGRDFTVKSLREKEFWALQDVSFRLNRGDAMGVIGLNGAGKTTLLRLLNGQFPPDRGEIRIAGSASSMIDLSVGLNDSMTGRENIYLRSASLGRRREEIDETLDEMIDFMELGDAIEAPISTYSAGMRMRLAFATTVFVNPDLLIIDEVLSVGDFRFRQKCLEHIRNLRSHCAFVLASHSMTDISRFCTEAIVLQKGRIVFTGAPEDAVKHYQQLQDETVRAQSKVRSKSVSKLGEFFHNEGEISGVSANWLGEHGELEKDGALRWGEKAQLKIEFDIGYAAKQVIVGVPIWRSDEAQMVSALSSEQAGYAVHPDESGRYSIEIEFDTKHFCPGTYESVLTVLDGPKFLIRQPLPHLTIGAGAAPMHWGRFILPQTWRRSGP